MSRYYPFGVWCSNYCMWCDDVVEITDGHNTCNGDCANCEYAEQETDESERKFKSNLY